MSEADFVGGFIAGVTITILVSIPATCWIESSARYSVYRQAISRDCATFNESGEFVWKVAPEKKSVE